MRRNNIRMDLYKEAIGTCCNPECETRYQSLDNHHIHPLSKGGHDDFKNYIILCSYCHNGMKLHSRWRERQKELLRWKHYSESLIIKHLSKDHSLRNYAKLLREHIKIFGGHRMDVDAFVKLYKQKVSKKLKNDNKKKIHICRKCNVGVVSWPTAHCDSCKKKRIRKNKVAYYLSIGKEPPPEDIRCDDCGAELDNGHRTFCEKCAKERVKEQRIRHRGKNNIPLSSAKKTCSECGVDISETTKTKYCAKCNQIARARWNEKSIQRSKAGLIIRNHNCAMCGDPFEKPTASRKYCKECSSKAKKEKTRIYHEQK